MESWDPTVETPKLQSAVVAGVEFRVGDPVRLWPLGIADIMDLTFEGKRARIVAIEQDLEDKIHFAVTVDDDPGRDLGVAGKPGHRFFFRPEEVESLRGELEGRS